MADTPSKLLSGNIYYQGSYIPIDEYRDKIFARSLYSIGNEYENTNKFSLNNKGNVASSISTVLSVIPQYNRMQVNTNLLSNVLDNSPIARIGLIMLGKQMAYNSAMNLSIKHIPSIDLSQALKGNPKDIFIFNKDNTISVKNKEDRTFLDKVGDVSSNIFGFDTYNVFGDDNPFNKTATNIDYIRNTGEAQLSRLFGGINSNTYKPINPKRSDSEIIVEYSNKVGLKLLSSKESILNSEKNGIRPIFNFYNNPYYKRKINSKAIKSATKIMLASYSITGDTVQEYAPDYQYIKDNFGDVTKPVLKPFIDYYVGRESNLRTTDDSNKNQLVWGRDGVAPEAEIFIKDLRGRFDGENKNPDNNIFNETNARKGLLEYTRNLLNATEGNFVDITRKAFKDGNEYVGFNGSPLWTPNDSKYSIASRNYNPSNGDSRFGVRQHTILDPYDKFAKTIRFQGNMVYNGNADSVINKTVLPKVHPTIKNDVVDKNLMFSFENLAIGTVKRNGEKYGIIDDELGSPIPLSEVGQFGGRKMWFPPYNLQVNEVAMAKYESTVMVGRNEPMYNYQNSERSAVVSFSLLVDYPEQLRNINLQGNDKNKEIADFFAFGGDPLPDEYTIERKEERIKILIDLIKSEGDPVKQAEPPNIKVPDVTIYYQNDSPKEDQVSTIINTMYNKRQHYEIIKGCLSSGDGNGFGLNSQIYFIEGLVETGTNSEVNKYVLTGDNINQYNKKLSEGQFKIKCILNQNLYDVFGDNLTRKYYNIKIIGTSSKLYLITEEEKAYNEALSKRRIAAAIELLKGRLTAMFGATEADKIVTNQIITQNNGSRGSSAIGADPKYMHDENVKKERATTIMFYRNNVPVDDKEQNLNPQQEKDIEQWKIEIEILTKEINLAKKNIKENIFNERTVNSNAISNGFESISKNEYNPAFHSQTPEDFHRRLTFLQQCTRQGAAKRFDVKDENGQLRAKNSVFGKQPICIMRVGDLFYTKVIIESVTIDYNDTTWDLNPEGFGLQPMIANITLQMKLIGGQSLKGPIDALQNAVSFNYYANSSFSDKGVYKKASDAANEQASFTEGIVVTKGAELNTAYKNKFEKTTEDE